MTSGAAGRPEVPRRAAGAGNGGSPDLPPEVLQRAAATFGLLAATMRFHIVWLLASEELDVGTLAERIGASMPAVSQQLAKLKLAGLVESRREGRRHVYLVADPMLVQLVRQMVENLAGKRAHLGRAGDSRA
jgi:DNA-binding transcriptional ArsR family regulator